MKTQSMLLLACAVLLLPACSVAGIPSSVPAPAAEAAKPAAISLPYFNDTWEDGRQGYAIVGHDPARWEAAVAAAMRLPLHRTTMREVEKLFGETHLAFENRGITESLSYFYAEHRDANVPKGYLYALEFHFDEKKRLQGVTVQLHPPLPEPH